MTDIEIKETADSFMKMGDILHETMAISINEVLSLAKDVEGAGLNTKSFCKDILVLRACKSIEDIESVAKVWIEKDGLLS